MPNTVEEEIALRSEENVKRGLPPVNMAAGRRAFMKSTGLLAAGATLLGTVGKSTPAAAQSAYVDVQILNFALNLEYLEAEFYLRAVSGHGIPDGESGGKGTFGQTTGGSAVPFQNAAVLDYANEIAQDELAHVRFIRAVLGPAAVARPAIDLETSFTTAARAANLISQTATFSPFADDSSFLLGSYIFEDVGVTAYHGAAPLITGKDILSYAAGILAVEAYHAGLVRTLCFARGLFTQTQQISALRFYLDLNGNDDQGVGRDQSTLPEGGYETYANIVPADKNGLVFARTPRQVLNIVYGTQDTTSTSGLFFPQGINPGDGPSILG